MTLGRNKKSVLLFAISLLVLFFNFFDHRLSTLSSERFLDNEFLSERYVLSRLVYDLDHGTKAEGGFMLRYHHADKLYHATDRDDYADFKKSLKGATYEPYNSHTGFQDDLVFPLWQGLTVIKQYILDHAKEGSRWHKRMLQYDLYYYFTVSQAVIAFINALVISLIVLWAGRQYGTAAGFFLLAAVIIAMPALAFFGRSLWWMMWAWFLPFVASLWAYRMSKGQPLNMLALSGLSLLVAGGVCLRGVMGYEYISTIGIAAIIPTAFYAVQNGWALKNWIVQSTAIGLFALLGLFAALYLHWVALESLGADPMRTIMEKYQMRASGGDYTATASDGIAESIAAPVLDVIATYLYHPQKIAIPQILLMLPFLAWFVPYVRGRRALLDDATRRQYDSLIAAIGIGFIGAISMFILLKGHSAIHGFDIVVWNVPMNFFLALFYWQWFQSRQVSSV